MYSLRCKWPVAELFLPEGIDKDSWEVEWPAWVEEQQLQEVDMVQLPLDAVWGEQGIGSQASFLASETSFLKQKGLHDNLILNPQNHRETESICKLY